MKMLKSLVCTLFFFGVQAAMAQIPSGVYTADVDNVRHEIKINDGYFIYSEYESNPAEFIRTLGGFAQVENTLGGEKLVVLLEFNSQYEQDSVRQLSIPVSMKDETLHLDWFAKLQLTPIKKTAQDLDGQWLFATRGPDKGQERRGEANTRKTLKYLQDGRFQWVAYDTNDMKFSGTGGGNYSAVNGVYVEQIEYFSRNNSRVGASLEFNYEVKGNDWHHTGKSSKGEPMYEIWSRRPTSE
ncbi:hypothetical protein ACFQZJ_01620 [Maribacter chungangensis]|uniref:Membrane or secreted protein n=1 Tax=Maribacter chungangensis TaxID=1069117 RepID=A0ABW3AYK2_9FLAO